MGKMSLVDIWKGRRRCSLWYKFFPLPPMDRDLFGDQGVEAQANSFPFIGEAIVNFVYGKEI